MTVQEHNYQGIIARLRAHAPEGRNVEVDIKVVAQVLAEAYRDGANPEDVRHRIITILRLPAAHDVNLGMNALLAKIKERSMYVSALWDSIGEYMLWALDTAAQHRTVQLFTEKLG